MACCVVELKFSAMQHMMSEVKQRQKYAFVIVHEKTRYQSKIAILDDADLNVSTLCYFMLKTRFAQRR